MARTTASKTGTGLDAQRLLQALDFERLAGTPGEQKAIDVIAGHLERMKLRPRVESFEIYGFDGGSAVLEAGGKSFDVHPYGVQKGGSVEGELVFVENADVLTYNQGAFRDKIEKYLWALRSEKPELRWEEKYRK